jgi:hypothetical protein
MRRRIFNLFAFALLAFAVCLIAFSKEEPLKQTGETAQVMNNAATIAATR